MRRYAFAVLLFSLCLALLGAKPAVAHEQIASGIQAVASDSDIVSHALADFADTDDTAVAMAKPIAKEKCHCTFLCNSATFITAEDAGKHLSLATVTSSWPTRSLASSRSSPPFKPPRS